jgi:hypothetical protein
MIEGQDWFSENIWFISIFFFMKLLPFKFPRHWNLDHDARVNLVNEGDTYSPDPVHTRELALDIHDANIKWYVASNALKSSERSKVFVGPRGMAQKQRGGPVRVAAPLRQAQSRL